MYKPYRYVRSNTGKQAISFGAIDLWKGLPDITKNIPLFSFFKQVKTYTYWLNNIPVEICIIYDINYTYYIFFSFSININ
jgi:hypothetical protein